ARGSVPARKLTPPARSVRTRVRTLTGHVRPKREPAFPRFYGRHGRCIACGAMTSTFRTTAVLLMLASCTGQKEPGSPPDGGAGSGGGAGTGSPVGGRGGQPGSTGGGGSGGSSVGGTGGSAGGTGGSAV